jgi:ferritin-like metal-binding protein YciE
MESFMPTNSVPQTLEQLFLQELRDIYDGEKQLVRALPKLARNASDPQLKAGIEEHLEQTEQHVARIENVFEMLDAPAKGKKCLGIQGLLKEGEEATKGDLDSAVKDAALIASAQKVEHYEMATYGTLCAWAKLLGREDEGELLHQTLEEEKAADEKLSQVARAVVNPQAA